MRDVKKYWQEIHTLEASLPTFVQVVSEEGTVVEVGCSLAAKLLHAKSHRLATEEEIQTRAAEEGARNREAAREGLRRRGIAVVAVE